MRAIIVFLLALASLAKAVDIDWSKVFPAHLKNPPHARMPHGIPSPRITGGQEAQPNSHPHMAALFIPVEGGTAFCGGTLIGKRSILTAAHCVDGSLEPILVVLGAHRIREDEFSQVKINSTEVLIHPQWSSLLLRYDIALVRLETEVVPNQFIQIISLASDRGNTFEGHEATAAGWGRESDESQVISDVLREVRIPVIANSACNNRFLGIIQNTHICASGSNGKSTCNGDSGGPLTVSRIQIGVVSFGIALGCEVGWPSVYSRVPEFYSWVAANLI